jgi:hypothetical protein
MNTLTRRLSSEPKMGRARTIHPCVALRLLFLSEKCFAVTGCQPRFIKQPLAKDAPAHTVVPEALQTTWHLQVDPPCLQC